MSAWEKFVTVGGSLLLGAALLAAAPPFQILTTHLPLPRAGYLYRAQLEATGGTPPYHWALLPGHGDLPPGLTLNPETGEITGRVHAIHGGAPFQVLVEVRDSSRPPLVETRLLPASESAPLSLVWVTAPARANQSMTGALRVTYGGLATPAEVVVIVVAVDETGKAFALRYARQPLDPGQSTPPLAFDVTLPSGAYTLHADVVATQSATGAIYRLHAQLDCAAASARCQP